ncbi:MAG TPA: IPT/TIG domain-containing protein [Planctomycetota bacterium]|nr:IPT/TIG domain-containing protein [Planctomycetota bacterium]
MSTPGASAGGPRTVLAPFFLASQIMLLLHCCSAHSAAGDTTADRVLGQANFTTANTGLTSSTFNYPWHAAIHASSGRLYVVDKNNHRVLSWPDAATFSNGAAADKVFGQNGSFTSAISNNNGLSASSLNAPLGIAVDANGNLYIADSGNNRVLIYDNPGTNDTIADRVLGQANFISANANVGGRSASSLSTPSGLCVDASGNLFVCDRDNARVLKFSAPITTNKAASMVFGQGGSFSTAVAGAGAGGLSGPESVAVDAGGNVFVADTANNRVLMFNTPAATDTLADRVFGQPDFNTTTGGVTASKLSIPYSVAVDANGTLYVADRANSRVLAFFFAADNDTIADVVFGQPNFTSGSPNAGGGATCSENTLAGPRGVALDGSRSVYIVDSDNIRLLGFDTPFSNPAPAISALNPQSVTAGGSAFELTVSGSAFVRSSVVKLNGSIRNTTFVSSSELKAFITSNDIAAAGTANITVFTDAPGGGTSSAMSFSIENPVPAIAGLTPSSADAGSSAFTQTIDGSNFTSNSSAAWNGSAKTVTFVSAMRITIPITAADLAAGGAFSVTVSNPAPGGGTSPPASFTVNNPLPALSSISPNSASAGGGAFTLTVNGSNFISGVSVVRWDGTDRATTFVSSSQLTAAISAEDIATEGSSSVSVYNPAPAGGTSAAATFLRQAAGSGAVPAITSPLSASGAPGKAFSYAITASNNPTSFDAVGLPDGLSLNTSTGVISGSPAAEGTYEITISAMNSSGKGSATLSLSVKPGGDAPGPTSTGSKSNADADGDGFPDEIEAALSSDANSTDATPFGGSNAGTPLDLIVSKLSVKLNFAKPGTSDTIQVSGTIPVPEGFAVLGQPFVISVGGVVRAFHLNEKGADTLGNDGVKLSVKARKNFVEAQLARYTVKFNKGAFAEALTDEGLADANLDSVALRLPVIIVFNQKLFRVDPLLLYSARAGKLGKTTQPRK